MPPPWIAWRARGGEVCDSVNLGATGHQRMQVLDYVIGYSVTMNTQR